MKELKAPVVPSHKPTILERSVELLGKRVSNIVTHLQ
jgi:hypothetical protein